MNNVKKAKKQLRDFLEKNPHMKKEQEKLDSLLKNTSENKRLEVLGILMSSKLLELQKQLIDLSKLLAEV
ncbi:MAG: hypothetical protein ACFFG0_00445 [Candidatus Thorarchaeota archaeon]